MFVSRRPLAPVLLPCFLLSLLLSPALLGCSAADSLRPAEKPAVCDLFAMDTYMSLTAYGEGAEEALSAAKKEIRRLDDMLSTGLSGSEISRLNQAGSAEISPDTYALIRRSKDLYQETGGLFDITVYPLMKAWGFTDGDYRIPDAEERSKLMQLMGPDAINLDEGHASFSKEGMQIDLGGIAKGYASERVIEILRQQGIRHAVINLGGNVCTLADKPDGSAWKIAIKDPEDPSGHLGVLEIRDQAVITSGSYERYFEKGGHSYHHIIDPATGCPAESGLISVTVISDDATLADGLSTALFIMGREKGSDYWREHSGEFEAVFLEEDGTVYVTEGIADSFSCDRPTELIRRS